MAQPTKVEPDDRYQGDFDFGASEPEVYHVVKQSKAAKRFAERQRKVDMILEGKNIQKPTKSA